MTEAEAGASGLIRVAVVDDHELVRSGICHALNMSPEIRVVGEAGDGLAALALLETREVDVLLLDLHMPRMDGFACLDAVTGRWPDLPVVILTVEEDQEIALDVMRRGAAAYVPKYVRPADLATLVRQVAGGAVLIGGNKLAGALGAMNRPGGDSNGHKPAHGLTQRELEVLNLVAQGMSNADIARALFITTKTVKYHLTTIFGKLGVRNRTEAAASAIAMGLTTQRVRSGPESAPR
jgi:two-component system, NarL family, response regulator LiaR